jgi:hypothetical protein
MYDPGISYHGDKFIYDAISSLGQDAVKAIQEREQMKKTGAYNDWIMNLAHQQGRVSEEDWNKYQAGSLTQKSGMATAHAANMADDLQRQRVDIQQKTASMQQALDAERIIASQQERKFVPSWEDQAATEATGGKIIQLGPGKFTTRDYPTTQPDTWEKLNQDFRAATGADLGEWAQADKKRVEKGYLVADITKPNPMAQMLPNVPPTLQQTARVPQTTYNQFVSRFNALKGGPPATDIGIDRQGQAAKIREQYQAKQISRDEAKKQLEALGIFQ